jgi:meiotic recombination protein SPO11
MTQIENIIYTLLECLTEEKSMILKIRKVKDWNQCEMNNDVLTQKETEITVKQVSFTKKNTERTFTVITTILCEIYKMLSRNTSCTKRELYYRDVELMKSQSTVDRAIDEICKLLNVMPWELGVLSSSKGLVAGNLQMTFNDTETINYSAVQSVPQNPSEISHVYSDAEYILIVEKDTVFTRMINENIFDNIESKIILMTAKGYPDLNTRLLLNRLYKDLSIPIYILTDADPHGVEIMCTYKYGSLQKVHNSEHIAVSCEWIGYKISFEKFNALVVC